MKSIQIDFAHPSFTRTVRRIHLATWFIGSLGLLLGGSAAVAMVNTVKQKDELRVEQQRLAAKLARNNVHKLSPKKSSISEAQAKAINNAIAQLNLPWRDVLDAIEVATPASIALLALEPDGKKQLLKGSAEAKTGDDMLSYVEGLKQQAFFDTVILSKHEVNEQDPNKPIRFQFEAHWAAEK